jgi:hypothetical protein
MAQIQIQTTSFIFTSYNVFVCDVYGNQCVLVANVVPPQPPTIVITIPPQFNTAPAVSIKLIDSLGCEIFKIVDCTQQYLTIKQFQDGDDFYFMDNEEYDFQT